MNSKAFKDLQASVRKAIQSENKEKVRGMIAEIDGLVACVTNRKDKARLRHIKRQLKPALLDDGQKAAAQKKLSQAWDHLHIADSILSEINSATKLSRTEYHLAQAAALLNSMTPLEKKAVSWMALEKRWKKLASLQLRLEQAKQQKEQQSVRRRKKSAPELSRR